MKRAIVVTIVVILVAGALYWGKTVSERRSRETDDALAAGASETTAVPVVVDEVRKGDIERILRYTGTLEPDDQIEVIPKISGRLIAIKVEEGDWVSKGQTLAVIDPEITGQRFEPFAVTSPIAGRVSLIYLDPGAFVMQGQPILQVIDDRVVKVRIGILEKDYHLVREGMPVRLRFDALPGRTFNATITKLGPVVDPRTGTAGAEIELENADGLLKPGMFARVEVVVEVHKDAVLLPLGATLAEIIPGRRKSVETTVYVVRGDTAYARDIKIGLRGHGYYEVLEGLKPGEKVVVVGQNLLQDSTAVRIVAESQG